MPSVGKLTVGGAGCLDDELMDVLFVILSHLCDGGVACLPGGGTSCLDDGDAGCLVFEGARGLVDGGARYLDD